MGIEIVWDDDAQTILRHIYTDPWTAQDVIDTVAVSFEMLAQIDHPIYRIVDLTATKQVPLDILKAGRVVLRQNPPNQVVAYVVGASNIVITSYKILATLYPHIKKSYLFVDTLEEAYARIAEHKQAPKTT